jgi:hypothetical protein
MIMKAKYFVPRIALALTIVGLIAPAIAMAGNNMVVTLRGEGQEMADPPIEGALCYPAVLEDTKNGRVIGSGIDCLEDIVLHPGDSIALSRTTYFFMPQGTLVAEGRTTVAPRYEGSPSVTHIVGDITAGNNILSDLGTGKFEGATGSVRLSGAVNMEQFPDGIIDFNCIFVIDLD